MGITGQKKNMSKSKGHAEECCVHVVAMAKTPNDRDGDWPIARRPGQGKIYVLWKELYATGTEEPLKALSREGHSQFALLKYHSQRCGGEASRDGTIGRENS